MSVPAVCPRLRISLAGPKDDPELRRLLRENPLPGAVAVSYEREPDFFLAAEVEGEEGRTLVARDGDTGSVVGLGSRSVHIACVNGKPRRIGYLGQLRLDRKCRGRAHLLFRGYEKLRELHDGDGETPFYLTSLVEGNDAARRFLTSGHPRLPRYRFLESFRTLVLDVRSVGPAAGRRAGPEDLPAISNCLRRYAVRHQFGRPWMPEDLLSPDLSRGLSVEDFQLAFAGGRVAGCLALWDQSGFKQAVVRGYPAGFGFLRLAVNVLGRLRGRRTVLPRVGEPLRMAFLSHLGVDGEDGRILLPLIRGAAAWARDRGIDRLMMGLSARNPMIEDVRRAFAPREYGSALYVVYWEDGERDVDLLDGRLCHVEAATL